MKNIEKIETNFTIMDNKIAQNQELSLGAKGLYWYMCSKPDDWKFSAQQMRKECGATETGLRRFINELMEHGLLTREFIHGKVHGSQVVYTLYGRKEVEQKTVLESKISESKKLEPKISEPKISEPKKLNHLQSNIYNKEISNTKECIEQRNTPAREKAPATFKAPTVDEAVAYFIANGYTEDSARRFFSYYDCAGWKDSNGKSVRNWKQKAQAVWFKDENKISKPIYNRPNNQDTCYESVEERVARFMRETGQMSTNEERTQNNATLEPSGGYLDYLNMASVWEPNQK